VLFGVSELFAGRNTQGMTDDAQPPARGPVQGVMVAVHGVNVITIAQHAGRVALVRFKICQPPGPFEQCDDTS
jgi:hypothetical protein